jgi:hypothetical protein
MRASSGRRSSTLIRRTPDVDEQADRDGLRQHRQRDGEVNAALQRADPIEHAEGKYGFFRRLEDCLHVRASSAGRSADALIS